MKLPVIKNARELADLVREIGFLPLFRCEIDGFSLQECTPAGYWFVKDVEGPWEWREEVAAEGEIAYAKLLTKKPGLSAKHGTLTSPITAGTDTTSTPDMMMDWPPCPANKLWMC